MNRNAGFTLIELMVTVVLAAIILTIGVPSFRTTIQNNSRVAQVNEFIGVLNLARSEAAKRGFRVIICRSTDGENCATDTTGVWENGWIVFVDQNQDGDFNPYTPDNQPDSTDVLNVQHSIARNFSLRDGSNFTQWVAYLPNGVSIGSTGLGTGTFRLCDSRGVDQARFIVINSTGRVRVREKETGDTCP